MLEYETFKTGEKAPRNGVYAFVRHTDPTGCQPTAEEREIRLEKGETFPPHRSCNKGVIWRFARP